MRRYSKILLALICVGVLLAVAFVPRRYPKRAWREAKREWQIATGGMHDVGGFYLRMECEGNGSPTVVFDSGLAQLRDTWGVVPEQIAKSTRVCSYDRANVGESDSVDRKRTSANAVEELKTLLNQAGESGPYVLVGHSFGGLNARLFAISFPDEVRGLVLVDPSNEDQYKLIPTYLSPDKADEYLRNESGENLEDMNIPASSEIVRSVAAPSELPAVILIPSSGASDQPWSEAVRNLSLKTAQLYPCGHLVRVPGSNHFIQLESPDAVIESIEWVLSKPKGSC